MRSFQAKRSSKKFWLGGLIVIFLVLGGGVVSLRVWYNHNLGPVSSSLQTAYFTVIPGSGAHQIAQSLKEAELIRSPQAFETYVRSNEFHDKLQAGTYALSPSMSVQQIVAKMVDGKVSRNLLTILPGKNLSQLKNIFSKAGYSSPEINKAFDPAKYRGHPALASLPGGASLEGFLYPDSFQKQANTPAQTIVRESLDEMARHLTPEITNGMAQKGLSIYKGVTLASIVGQESDDPDVQPMVAQVFYSRLASGMILGSDVTARYAAYLNGTEVNYGSQSAYNTRVHAGLPPGPISNVTASALKAVAHPAKTDYLYFLYGDDKKMHFTRTQTEHDAAIVKYCAKNCQ